MRWGGSELAKLSVTRTFVPLKAIEALNALERDSMAQQAMHDIKTFTKSGKKARVRKLVKVRQG